MNIASSSIEIDGGIPQGEEWHKRLLPNMTIKIEGVRPPVYLLISIIA